jgi:surface protein
MEDFISTWNVGNGATIVLPIINGTVLNCTVLWGDGAQNTYNNYTVGVTNSAPSHPYTVGGTYTITVQGPLPGWNFTTVPTSRLEIRSIVSYGGLQLSTTGNGHFAQSLISTFPVYTENAPKLILPEDCSNFFYSCTSLNANTDLRTLNTANVKNMTNMFSYCFSFNGDISTWNVQSVENMSNMFLTCYSFNGDISEWNVQNVLTMERMFFRCQVFNRNLTNWNVQRVTNMYLMFCFCSVFNGDISSWNVSNVINMANMFFGCLAFRRDLSKWVLSKISNDANAPAFTATYIREVKPNFGTYNLNAWSFTSPVTANVINTIIPDAASRAQYQMKGLRLTLKSPDHRNGFNGNLSPSVIMSSSYIGSAIMDNI